VDDTIMPRLFSATHWYTPSSFNATFLNISLFEITCALPLKGHKGKISLCRLPKSISFTVVRKLGHEIIVQVN